MLEAIAHKKRLSGRPYEDEVTAAVFGPLRYLPASESWKLFLKLLGKSAARSELQSFKPARISIKFWPRESICFHNENNRVEPDALITYTDGNNDTCSIILEIKWSDERGISAPLSSKDPEGRYDQLARQWVAFGVEQPKTTWHLFITPEPASPEINDCQASLEAGTSTEIMKQWKSHFCHATWHRLSGIAKNTTRATPSLRQWGNDVNTALLRLGIRDFRGFNIAEWHQLNLPPTLQWRLELFGATRALCTHTPELPKAFPSFLSGASA